MKKAIVTGGAGFIGHHIVKALIKKGYEVHIIDNMVAGKQERIQPEAIFHQVDVRDLAAIKPIILGADYVFHLAALPRVQHSIDDPVETNEVNVIGTANVLIAAAEAKVKKVVYSASGAAYGDQPTLPLHEEMPANPKSPYGLQKYIGEWYCKTWSLVYGLPTVSLRYFNVYGPGFDAEGAYALVVGKFLDQRKHGQPITITGTGEQTRDFVHVYDVANANIMAAESQTVGNGEVINIGSGKSLSINDIAKAIGGPVEYIPARLEPKDNLADISKAQKLLGWQPTVTIEQGIAELKTIAGLA